MILRPYQVDAIRETFSQWNKGVRSTAIVMATALGKTIVFAHIGKQKWEETGKRILVLAHRKELIDQAKEKIERATGLKCDIEMGSQFANMDMFRPNPVVIATVQSLNSGTPKRMERFDPTDFCLVICDEFHHGTADTYKRVFEHFKKNPTLVIVGVTATIDRADGDSISQICESKAFEFDILDGVTEGWLVPVTQQFVPVSSLDLSHVHTNSEGDLKKGELEKIMEAEENVQGVCHPALEVLYGLEPKTLSKYPVPEWGAYLKSLNRTPRRSIVFTISVAQAEACCNILNRVVDGLAEWVCGDTPTKDREAILERFADGRTAVVVNCGVLTEGYDNPPVEVIFMARPTKSRSLYTQMVGRATRTLPGTVDGLETAQERKDAIMACPKCRCRIIDFVGNSGRHKLICAIDILSGKCSEQAVERAIQKAKDGGKPVTVVRILSNAELELESERKRRAEEWRLAEEARKRRIVAKANFDSIEVDPFGNSGPMSKWQKTFKHDGSTTSKDGRKFSDKQLYWLHDAGVNAHSIGYRQGQAIINKQRVKLRPKQKVWLEKNGYNPSEFTKDMCSQIMDAWAKNGWRRPVEAEAQLLGA